MPWSRIGVRFACLSLLLLTGALPVVGCGNSGSDSTGKEAGGADPDSGQVRVAWQEPETEEDAIGEELLKASETEEVAAYLAKAFELPNPLLIRGVNGTEPGPYYYPEDNSITLPYGFAALVFDVLSESNPEASPEVLGEQTGAVNSFILAHEFAHALIENFSLSVLGKEEDAADSIATLILLDVPGGTTYATDAAYFWANFSGRQEPPAVLDYADVHSLDLQRAFDILCWTAGSSRMAHEEVTELEVLPESRLETCPEEYEQVAGSIEQELKPHLKGDSLEG